MEELIQRLRWVARDFENTMPHQCGGLQCPSCYPKGKIDKLTELVDALEITYRKFKWEHPDVEGL